jgi:flavin reductase
VPSIEQPPERTAPRSAGGPGVADVAAPSPAAFRAAMGSFLTGVAVMTTEARGAPHGMTANAVSSVSLTPPLVLVCVDRTAHMASAVADAEVFALSFLAEDQAELSNHFADGSRGEGEEEFVGVDWSVAATGARVLAGAVGFVDCRVDTIAEAGDHLIVIGEVVALGARDELAPLAYFRGGYGGYRPAAPVDRR